MSVCVCVCVCVGPVFVELPIDTLYPYSLVHHEAGITAGKTLGQRLINWCVHLSVCLCEHGLTLNAACDSSENLT